MRTYKMYFCQEKFKPFLTNWKNSLISSTWRQKVRIFSNKIAIISRSEDRTIQVVVFYTKLGAYIHWNWNLEDIWKWVKRIRTRWPLIRNGFFLILFLIEWFIVSERREEEKSWEEIETNLVWVLAEYRCKLGSTISVGRLDSEQGYESMILWNELDRISFPEKQKEEKNWIEFCSSSIKALFEKKGGADKLLSIFSPEIT